VEGSFSDARAISASRHRCSYVTLRGTLAWLLVLHSSPQFFEEKRDCSQSITHTHTHTHSLTDPRTHSLTHQPIKILYVKMAKHGTEVEVEKYKTWTPGPWAGSIKVWTRSMDPHFSYSVTLQENNENIKEVNCKKIIHSNISNDN